MQNIKGILQKVYSATETNISNSLDLHIFMHKVTEVPPCGNIVAYRKDDFPDRSVPAIQPLPDKVM